MEKSSFFVGQWVNFSTASGDVMRGKIDSLRDDAARVVIIGTNRAFIDLDELTPAGDDVNSYSPLPAWLKEGINVNGLGIISAVERFSVVFENGNKKGIFPLLLQNYPLIIEEIEDVTTETETEDETPKQEPAPKVKAQKKAAPASTEALAKELAATLAKLASNSQVPAQIDPAQISAITAQITALSERLEVLEKQTPKEYTFKIAEFNGKMKGAKHEKFDMCLKMLAAGANIYLCGPAGTGKSFLAKQLADALGLEFHETNAVVDQFSLAGFIDARGEYQETEFYRAYRYGGVHHLDEADCGEAGALKWMNNAVANDYCAFPCGIIRKHKNFRCIASGNTVGRGATEEYTAGNTLDASTLTRFIVVTIDYCKSIELQISGNDAALVEFVYALRDAANKNGMNTALLGRVLKNAATMKRAGITDAAEIVCSTFANYMTVDENRLLARSLPEDTKNIYMQEYITKFAAA